MDQSSSRSIPIDERFGALARTDRRAVIQSFLDESTEEVTLDDPVTGIVDGSYWDMDESHARLCLGQPAIEQLLDAVSETGLE